MPALDGDDRAAVEAHVRRLGPDALAALVADLWDARGFETVRDGTTVTAASDHGRVVISIGEAGEYDDAADLVVDTSGSAHDGIETLDAADLAEQLWYAVDRPTARELCERHLGAEPSALGVPAGERIRRSVFRLRPRLSAVVLAGLAVVLLGGVALGLATVQEQSSERPSDQRETPSGVAGAPTISPPEPLDASAFPPGVGRNGIEDLRTLGRAHEHVLAFRSYSTYLSVSVPEIRNYSVVRVRRNVTFRTDGEEYLAVADEVIGGDRERIAVRYHDGDDTYAAVPNGTTTTYRRVGPLDRRDGLVDSPTELTGALAATRLSTPESRLTGTVRRDGERLYRIVGTGQPAWPALGRVENYSVVALVRSDGLVRSLHVEYTVIAGDRLVTVRRWLRYDRIDETDVVAPPWYRQRFGDDGTGNGADPGR